MSDLEFNARVQNGWVISNVEKAIKKGMHSSADDIGARMGETAIQRLQEVGAIWTGDLQSSFEITITRAGSKKIIVVLKNDAEHARPIEYGATYEDEGPPIAALIPWVEAKMQWWDPTDEAERYEPVDIDHLRNLAREEADNERTDAFAMGASEETIRKAFFLQQHIKEKGIDAVRYMREAHDFADDRGSDIVAGNISKELNKL